MRMKDGVVMEGKDGARYLHKNDVIWKQITEKGTLVPVGERAEAQGRGRPGDLFRFDGPLTGTWARELPWGEELR